MTNLALPLRTQPSPFLRPHYQLAGGLLVAIAGPVVIRAAWRGETDVAFSQNMGSSLAGTLAALLLGFWFYRKMTYFPGIRANAYVLPSFVFSYGAVFAVYFFLRLDYSRFQVGMSLALAIVWFFSFNVAQRRFRALRLAVVPGGNVRRLRQLGSIEWQWLGKAGAPPDGVDGVVVDLRADLSQEWERFISDAALSGTPVYHLKQVIESVSGKVDFERLSENTLGSLNPNHLYLKLKQGTDWCVALAALFLYAPLAALIALAIKLDSAGPAFYLQRRMGYRGQPFMLYKFRTMTVDGSRYRNAGIRNAITTLDDDRITRVGRILRRTRLDELPQVINILRGEMSWIGPRPEALVLSEWYENELPYYRYRHIVRPGITGWAQVNQGHVAEIDQVLEKLYYDFYYIKNFSMWLDLLIVMKTVRTVLNGFGAR